MSITSDKMVQRASEFVGRRLTSDEVDEFRRMSEMINRGEDDIAWTIVLAMWAARASTISNLKDARDEVQAGVEAWVDRVVADMKAIDENRRSMTKEVAEEAGKNRASIMMAAQEGTSTLAERLAVLEVQVTAMASTVERAMADASGVLAAAKKRDADVHEQIRELIVDHSNYLSNIVHGKLNGAIESAGRRFERAATQAQIAAKPLLMMASVVIICIAFGYFSNFLLIKYYVLLP